MNSNFEEQMRDYGSAVDQALDSYLPKETGEYNVVRRAMRYSVQAGGKRIRPILACEFGKICGVSREKVMPFACAIELVHTYSLIHDDLPCMDDDALRRGKPSCHVAFGEANALLAGDGLLTYAFELIADAPKFSGVSDAACVKAARILAKEAGVFGMIGGQTMDLCCEGKQIDADTLTELQRKKTSALLSAACQMGVVAADAGDEMLQKASRFGNVLGLAFQTIDDILDVTGDEKSLGKPIGSDSGNQKVTMVTLYSLEKAKKIADQLTNEALLTIQTLPNSEFLQELTHWLLTRRH